MLTGANIETLIKGLVNDYNSLCSKHSLKHRVKYLSLYEKLITASEEQMSYGSYQCQLVSGNEQIRNYLIAAIRVLKFEYGE